MKVRDEENTGNATYANGDRLLRRARSSACFQVVSNSREEAKLVKKANMNRVTWVLIEGHDSIEDKDIALGDSYMKVGTVLRGFGTDLFRLNSDANMVFVGSIKDERNTRMLLFREHICAQLKPIYAAFYYLSLNLIATGEGREYFEIPVTKVEVIENKLPVDVDSAWDQVDVFEVLGRNGQLTERAI